MITSAFPRPCCWQFGCAVQWWLPAQSLAPVPDSCRPASSLSLRGRKYATISVGAMCIFLFDLKQKTNICTSFSVFIDIQNSDNSFDSPFSEHTMINTPGLLRRHLSSYSTSACLSSRFCCFALQGGTFTEHVKVHYLGWVGQLHEQAWVTFGLCCSPILTCRPAQLLGALKGVFHGWEWTSLPTGAPHPHLYKQ